MNRSRVALVTDWITKTGGGEKVVEQFHRLYPEAPIYTSYCSAAWRKRLDDAVITGYLQHWPFSSLRRFLPVLRQYWFRKLDLSSYDILISITGNGEAKFVQKASSQQHICYCHTPVHFYWAQYDEYLTLPSMRPYWLVRLGMRLLVKPLRKRDYAAAQKVDHFIANSTSIQQDIKKFYDCESTVVFPPIDIEQFIQLSPRGEKSRIPKVPNCIWWGRVVPAKRLDVAIEACNQLKWPLVIIGDGPDLPRLKSLAGPTVTFTGYVDDEKRNVFIKKADLFIFPSKEDFGVAPVEALAAGLPVIAYEAGGALDYVKPDVNGLTFAEQTSASLQSILSATIGKTFLKNEITQSAAQFSSERFRNDIGAYISRYEDKKKVS